MATQMTVTEALAEIKTLQNRREKKRQFKLQYLTRQDFQVDPLAKVGGAQTHLNEIQQSINDLEARQIKLRRAISVVNLANSLTIEGETRLVQDWLTWKRDISHEQRNFLNQQTSEIHRRREEAQRKGKQLTQEENNEPRGDVLVHIDVKKLAEDQDRLEKVLGTLDGRLSVFNATTQVTVDD